MITAKDFNKIVYHSPDSDAMNKGVDITDVIGIDSEALINGKPFLFCMSDGNYIFDFTDKINFKLFDLFFNDYLNCHFLVFNLKYESGALCYHLSKEDKILLWKSGDITIRHQDKKLKISYIPHKHLRLSWGKNKNVYIWDVMPFFQSSLNTASKKYLNKSKLEMPHKRFTVSYVSENKKKIIEYCKQDALLTKELGEFLIDKINKFGLRCTSLYSQASLSLRYFQDKSGIVDVGRYFKYYKDVLAFAIDAYQGGKFEVTSKGSFYGYEYDIVSAYPYEISQLVNIRYAKIIRSKQYQKEAYYGFLRIKVECFNEVHLPMGQMVHYTRIYGIGKYYCTVTKNEYDYMKKIGIKIVIIDAIWLMIDTIDYPYRKAMSELYNLKSNCDKKDFTYNLIKICMNGFYGKMIQMIPDSKNEDQIRAGIAWNPIYGAIITANTRLKVTEIQNTLKNDCLAVHTDSVLTTCKLPNTLVTGGLGEYSYVTEGKGVIISCGCYQIGKQCAFKGFEPENNMDWFDILKKYRKRKTIPYNILRVESLWESTAKGHFDRLNLFEDHPKDMSVNADIKRIWEKDEMKCGDFLNRLYRSSSQIIHDCTKPTHWKDHYE